jgi:hypothetical protein
VPPTKELARHPAGTLEGLREAVDQQRSERWSRLELLLVAAGVILVFGLGFLIFANLPRR